MMRFCVLSFVVMLAVTAVRADDAEDKAVKYVESLGGKVERDAQQPSKPVVRVVLSRSKMTDEGLKELAGLKKLAQLDLSNTAITDAGVKELAKMKTLIWLDLAFTKITDTGLKDLAGMKDLKTLGLAQVETVTKAGLADLQKQLPGCEIAR